MGGKSGNGHPACASGMAEIRGMKPNKPKQLQPCIWVVETRYPDELGFIAEDQCFNAKKLAEIWALTLVKRKVRARVRRYQRVS